MRRSLGPGQDQPLLALTAPPAQAALTAPLARAALPAPKTRGAVSSASAQVPCPKSGGSAPSEPILSVGKGPSFVPSYEWEPVPANANIPPGLEVRMSMDGSGDRHARIPPTWRMLVVAMPVNEGCRLEVTRSSTLADVRAGVAAELVGGDVCRITGLLSDDVPIAGAGRPESCWGMTVGHSQLFGKRITCMLDVTAEPEIAVAAINSAEVAEFDQLRDQLCEIEAAVTKIEAALENSRITVGRAHSDLAQLEAQLERLQCRGIDAAPATGEFSKNQRQKLTRSAELIHSRLGGLLVGLGASKRHLT